MNAINQKTKTVFRIFLPWQDEKEINWLETMASEGWLFIQYSFLRYTFLKTEPKEYVFRLDYKTTNEKDIEEYKEIFAHSGWEHVSSFAGWQYLRIPKADFTTDIYTDKTSKIEKLRRQSALALAALSPMVIFLVIIMPRADTAFDRYNLSFFQILLPIIFIVMMLSMLMNAIWLLKLTQRIKELENDQ